MKQYFLLNTKNFQILGQPIGTQTRYHLLLYTGIWKHVATVWTPRALKVNIVNFTVFLPPAGQEMVVTLQRTKNISLTGLILILT